MHSTSLLSDDNKRSTFPAFTGVESGEASGWTLLHEPSLEKNAKLGGKEREVWCCAGDVIASEEFTDHSPKECKISTDVNADDDSLANNRVVNCNMTEHASNDTFIDEECLEDKALTEGCESDQCSVSSISHPSETDSIEEGLAVEISVEPIANDPERSQSQSLSSSGHAPLQLHFPDAVDKVDSSSEPVAKNVSHVPEDDPLVSQSQGDSKLSSKHIPSMNATSIEDVQGSSGSRNTDDHSYHHSISIHRDDAGETSFSKAMLISYTETIMHPGSVSMRSDGSISSRSFAFPILSSEWNHSPVKMAKADSRKHKGRRSSVFCCRF